MIIANRAFAWEADGKFYLSKLPPKSKWQPINVYDTRDALAIAARQRKIAVTWVTP